MPNHALPRRSMRRGADGGWKLVAGITSYKTTGWWFGIFYFFPYWEESQVTNSYFSEGQAQPPTRQEKAGLPCRTAAQTIRLFNRLQSVSLPKSRHGRPDYSEVFGSKLLDSKSMRSDSITCKLFLSPVLCLKYFFCWNHVPCGD